MLSVLKNMLLHLLPEWAMPAGGIYAVYPSARYLPAKVRILLDFMRARLKA
ncbi:hypothetical protein [Iodobacter ciconiae]|uniref:LysR family transcriptional regulator n=1 Tax=Iodobacter ciconiae TaxID=2496266 RepID=A0A3S8ZRH8_9NEIS|nr:hypothetical protein [Iodobacter ciconiae]AZN36092.1 hypothetical protein EJO50_06135 [Iodobacter ciconiae]